MNMIKNCYKMTLKLKKRQNMQNKCYNYKLLQKTNIEHGKHCM